ncbi:AsmA domain protein [Leptospira sp. GIMC2001]|uniref:AsmA domain protein n=1 Tax=Leptospira sp. GIMC2001 TaxID=1513297 RepID=UPI00234A43C8|nr:AsmA domain protein [Leptospira sp. GIMC2001]WCL47972.1 AsmA domain protein [Leptospira sp. GIMC2001]
MLKKVGIGIGGFFLVLIVTSVIGLLLLSSFLTPEFLTKQIESSINVRASVDKVNISLFSALSSVEIEGIQFAKRDSVADSGQPLSERKELQNAVLSLGKVELGLSFGAILKKEFRLDKLLLIEPKIDLVLFENGSNNLSSLFLPPVTVDGEPNPSLTPEALAKRKEAEEEAKRSEASNTSKEPFSIKTVPVSLNVGSLGIKNGDIQVTMKKTGQIIQLGGTDLVISDLDIVPDDLENHNSLKLQFSSDILVLGAGRKESAKFILNSNGTITPFDMKSGEVNPAIVHSVTLEEESFINGFAAFDALSGSLPVLKSANIKMDKLSQKAELKKDVSFKVGYSKGRVSFKDSPVFPTTNYDLKIEEGSWIQITDNSHLLRGNIVASKDESDKALKDINKSLASAKGVDSEGIKKQLLGNILQGDRIALPFQSSGNIKNPIVTLAIQLPSLTDLLKGQATKAVKDAIGKELEGKIPGGAKDALKSFGF